MEESENETSEGTSVGQNWKNLKECDKVWGFPNDYDHLYGFLCSYVKDEDRKLIRPHDNSQFSWIDRCLLH